MSLKRHPRLEAPQRKRPGRVADEEEHILIDVHASRLRLPLLAIAAVLALALLLPVGAAAKAGNHRGSDGKAKVHHQRGHHGKSHRHGKSHQGHSHGKGKVANVMTRNIYLGADLGPVIAAGNLEQVVTAAGVVFRQVLANEFQTRADGLADEILRTKPDLVGLQEVAHWQTTPITPAGTALTLDYLGMLLAELNEGKGKNGKGKPQYRVVVVQNEFGTEAPADVNGIAGDGPPLPELGNAEVMGKLTMRDVILARNGAGVRTWNEDGGNFQTLLELPVGGQLVSVLRGWTATDAKVRGSHAFRLVNTHLEAFHPLIREAQAKELVAPGGPAVSSRPVVLVGDLNSDDDTVAGADTLAYNFLLGAGFVNRSTDDPLSCCLNSAFLEVGKGGSVADFDHQVDHILTSDPDVVKLQNSLVTGLQPVNDFWNSDHAGVFSALRFKK
jgi:endonuclease/exonuclease/phosphatase family metal-dependent hydrolase